jgi:hypothetical protein
MRSLGFVRHLPCAQHKGVWRLWLNNGSGYAVKISSVSRRVVCCVVLAVESALLSSCTCPGAIICLFFVKERTGCGQSVLGALLIAACGQAAACAVSQGAG